MDAISDVLRAVRLDGAVYLRAEFTEPWSIVGQADRGLCASFLPRVGRIVPFHLITEGECHARLADDPSSVLQLNAGELLVVPQGDEHILASDLGLAPGPSTGTLAPRAQAAPGKVIAFSVGGGGARTGAVCGYLACDDTLPNPLLESLPRLFKVNLRDHPRSAWLESSISFAATEAAESRAGSSIVLSRLSELLFVEAVRRWIEGLPEDRKGWLAGVRDRFVGRALATLHAKPAQDWTVDELAREVGLSRSALAQRFTDLIGQPPMQYLKRWRMQLAAQEIALSNRPLAAIAAQVGYESEAAFNRAFRREFGMPPATWRKARAR